MFVSELVYGSGRYRYRSIRPPRVRDKHERALGLSGFRGTLVPILDPAVYVDHVVENDVKRCHIRSVNRYLKIMGICVIIVVA